MEMAIPVAGVTVLNLMAARFKTGRSRVASRIDPAPDLILEMLGSSLHWSMAADLADAYGGACIAACEDRPGLWGPKWSS